MFADNDLSCWWVWLKNVEMAWSIKGRFLWAEKEWYDFYLKILWIELWWNRKGLLSVLELKKRKTYCSAYMDIPVVCKEQLPSPQNRVYKTPLSQLFPNISTLREDPPNVSLFSPSFYFSLVIKFFYNKFCRMYGNRKYQLEMEIAWFTIRLVLIAPWALKLRKYFVKKD